jgi:two-component system heavy metal sensor histidine kinase CusS
VHAFDEMKSWVGFGPADEANLRAVGPLVDPELVHQVLLNLVLNAIQAVEGAGEVRIQVQPGRVVVSDSGPGIPPENIEKVFAPFALELP